jgi:hypothetical protein
VIGEDEADDARDMYIQFAGRELALTNVSVVPHSPVYRVTVRAKNGAGIVSDPKTSFPIIVLPEDKTGT